MRRGSIIARLAAEDVRLPVLDGSPLLDGWMGKPRALTQGARAARGEWLCLTDADTTHEPLAAASTVGFTLERGRDILRSRRRWA